MTSRKNDPVYEKYEELIKKYDIQNGYKDEPVPYNLFNGYVGEGWFFITEKLFQDLIDNGWDRKLCQMKEKLGGARYYIGEGNDTLWKLIEEAEDECSKTCEACGTKENVSRRTNKGKYWILTLCDKCRNEGNEDENKNGEENEPT